MVEVHEQTGSNFCDIQNMFSHSKPLISSRLSKGLLQQSVLLDSIEPENHTFLIESFSIEAMVSEQDLPLIPVQKDYGAGELLSKEHQQMDSQSMSQSLIQKGQELLMRIQLMIQRFSLWLSFHQVALSTTPWVQLTKMPFKI